MHEPCQRFPYDIPALLVEIGSQRVSTWVCVAPAGVEHLLDLLLGGDGQQGLVVHVCEAGLHLREKDVLSKGVKWSRVEEVSSYIVLQGYGAG